MESVSSLGKNINENSWYNFSLICCILYRKQAYCCLPAASSIQANTSSKSFEINEYDFFSFLQGANHCLVYRHLAPAKVLLYKTANLDKFICLYLLVFRSHFHHHRWIPKVCCWFWLCSKLLLCNCGIHPQCNYWLDRMASLLQCSTGIQSASIPFSWY